MLDLRRLRILRELEARGTVHAVAAALSYSPSGVSAQLAALEREVGVALTERVGRNLRLTEAGARLAHHAADLLDRAEAAAADVAASATTVAGAVRVSSFQSAMLRLVTPAMAAVTAEHPQVRMEIAEIEVEEALPALARGALDVVVGDEYDGIPMPVPAGVRRERLLRERIRLIVPAEHPLAHAHPRAVPLAELRDAPWAVGSPGTSHRQVVLRTCRGVGGFEPDLRHHSNDLLVLLALVREGGAFALLPELVDASGHPGVAVRELADLDLGRTVWMISREAAESRPAIAAVLAALRSAVP